MPIETVLLAEPRGFCAGVDMAIKALAWMVRMFEPPVYCFHEIVHNQLVVDRFEELGVRFVNDISEVPPGAAIMLSAHGSAPEVVERAYARERVVVDAVCPLVTKVHHEARRRADQGYEIVYVGHAGHDEAVGTLAVAPQSMHLVESESDLPALFDELGNDAAVALLTQTTLSTDEWDGVLRRTQTHYPDLWTAGRSDLCFATTNRQAAVRAIAPRCDAIIVIGSANSSNTLALAHVASEAGCDLVQRVNGADEIDMAVLSSATVVGVTAGASAPEDIVQAVIERLNPRLGVEHVRVTEEDEYFPPPRGLRELMPLVEALSAFSVGADPNSGNGGSFSEDRNVDTATTLSALSARAGRSEPANVDL